MTRAAWAIAAIASIGAGVIHLVLGPEHVDELGLLGYGFFLSGALQLWWAVLVGVMLARWRDGAPEALIRRLASAGVAINLAILAAWAVSRTIGLPAGSTPWTPEAIGLADTIAGLFEGLLVIGLGAIALRRHVVVPAAPRAVGIAMTVLAIALIGAGTTLAVASPESGHGHGLDTVHSEDAAHDH